MQGSPNPLCIAPFPRRQNHATLAICDSPSQWTLRSAALASQEYRPAANTLPRSPKESPLIRNVDVAACGTLITAVGPPRKGIKGVEMEEGEAWGPNLTRTPIRQP